MAGYVAEAVRMAAYGETFSALPRAGGLLDQPAGLLRRMALYRNYKTAVDMVEERLPAPKPLPEEIERLVALGVSVRLRIALLWEASRAEVE